MAQRSYDTLVCLLGLVPATVAGLIAKYAKNRSFLRWFLLGGLISMTCMVLAITLTMLMEANSAPLIIMFGVAAIGPIVVALLPKRAAKAPSEPAEPNAEE